MIDWKCSKCGFKPGLITPAAYDGWIRFEISTVVRGVATRQGLYTLDSLDCALEVLMQLVLSVRSNMAANAVDEIDELRAKVDAAEVLINEGLETDMAVGEEIVFEGEGFRHVLRKIADEPTEPGPAGPGSLDDP